MKIAWLFPVNKKCGISFYANEYINALNNFIDVNVFDINECLNNLKCFAVKLNNYDCIHIQYETSFFFIDKKNRYKDLCSVLKKPLVVSFHEVYKEFPGVFPRSEIAGRGLMRLCKEYIYDLRHSYQTAYTEHVKSYFYAHTLLVHSNHQKSILVAQGVSADNITVIPLPVKTVKNSSNISFMEAGTLHLASHGFITPHYNYTLLFKILDSLTIPWRFTWIGGVRKEEDVLLFDAINKNIAEHNWQEKCSITGWVSNEKRDTLLSQVDIYLALFSARSSSASLATALGAEKLIIATDLPLTRELVQDAQILSVCPAESNAVVNIINRLVSDKSYRHTYLQEIKKYTDNVSYRNMAKKVIAIYKDLIV